jgi:hypothetical protein
VDSGLCSYCCWKIVNGIFIINWVVELKDQVLRVVAVALGMMLGWRVRGRDHSAFLGNNT